VTKFIVRCRNVLPYLCGSAIGIGIFEAFLQFADEYDDPNWWDDTLFPLVAGILAFTIAGSSTYMFRLALRRLVAPDATSEADHFFE
jgi:hypothetical protein